MFELGGVVEDDEAFHSGGVRVGMEREGNERGRVPDSLGDYVEVVLRVCVSVWGVEGEGMGDGGLGVTFGPWGLEELYWLMATGRVSEGLRGGWGVGWIIPPQMTKRAWGLARASATLRISPPTCGGLVGC